MAAYQYDDWLAYLRDSTEPDARETCPNPDCGEHALCFAHHIRESVPGDEGDVYTIGETWECYACGHSVDRLD